MSEENKSVNSRFTLFSVIIIISGVLAAFLGFKLTNGSNWLKLIGPAAIIICADFVFLFYYGDKDKSHNISIHTFLICSILPCGSFLVSALQISELISAMLLLTVVTICAECDFFSAMIFLMSSAGYLALFNSVQFTVQLPVLITALLICVFVSRAENPKNIIPSVVVSLMFFATVNIIASDFDLSCLTGITFCLILLVIVSVTVAGVFLRIHHLEQSEISNPAENSSQHMTRKEAADIRNENANLKARISKLIEQSEQLTAEYNNYRSTKEDLEPANPILTKVSLAHINSKQFAYSKDLEAANPKLYRHSSEVARISSEACELIGCDTEFAHAIGLCHEAQRFLGDDFSRILCEKYFVPTYLARIIELTRNKANVRPIPREAGIVLLTDDIINTVNYLRTSKKESIPMERIVTNTIKVRKDQNLLRLAGFSNEEIQLLKLYLIEAGGKYGTSD